MKTLAACVTFVAAALTMAPIAQADMQVGTYMANTDRDRGHNWLWSIRPCVTFLPGCLTIQSVPQPNGQAAWYRSDAHLANGRYTMSVDVPDGVRCVVQFFPSHDVYSWDAVSLSGELVSTYDTGCGGGPGGTDSYPFTLVRWG